MKEYNVYCDESCHLRRDGNTIMVLGGIYCPAEKAADFNKEIIRLKTEHGWNPHTELKWTKVAPSNVDLYKDIVNCFFENKELQFRGYIARGKDELNLDSDMEYNDWYYKMYYRMLEYILNDHLEDSFNFYIDIKDTIGSDKVKRLQTYLNNHYRKEIVKRAQLVYSNHIALLQMADILIGALSYKNRNLKSSESKMSVIDEIERRSGENLLSSVPISNKKTNWFIWVPDTWR